MAIPTTFDIDFACGHTEERDLSSKPAGKRKGLANWLATKNCSECNRKENADEYKEKLYQNALNNQISLELPPLEGTEKQLRWATTSRNTVLMAAFEEFVRGEHALMDEEAFDAQFLVPARTIVAARWWIDYRDTEPSDLKECLDTALEETSDVNENPY